MELMHKGSIEIKENGRIQQLGNAVKVFKVAVTETEDEKQDDENQNDEQENGDEESQSVLQEDSNTASDKNICDLPTMPIEKPEPVNEPETSASADYPCMNENSEANETTENAEINICDLPTMAMPEVTNDDKDNQAEQIENLDGSYECVNEDMDTSEVLATALETINDTSDFQIEKTNHSMAGSGENDSGSSSEAETDLCDMDDEIEVAEKTLSLNQDSITTKVQEIMDMESTILGQPERTSTPAIMDENPHDELTKATSAQERLFREISNTLPIQSLEILKEPSSKPEIQPQAELKTKKKDRRSSGGITKRYKLRPQFKSRISLNPKGPCDNCTHTVAGTIWSCIDCGYWSYHRHGLKSHRKRLSH